MMPSVPSSQLSEALKFASKFVLGKVKQGRGRLRASEESSFVGPNTLSALAFQIQISGKIN